MKKIVIIAIVMSVLVASGVLALKTKRMDSELKETTQKVTSDPTMKPVTKDDSFTSIDSDINNTVIMQEDFSDL